MTNNDVKCLDCRGITIIKYGLAGEGKQRIDDMKTFAIKNIYFEL